MELIKSSYIVGSMGCTKLKYQNFSFLEITYPKKRVSEEKKRINYYPFGLKHKGYNTAINGTHHKYGFGGKEEQDDDLGGSQLNWLDFGARNYDPALGRWFNIDPYAELMRNQSPYNFAFNNPVYFSDSEGTIPWPLPEVYLNWLRRNEPDSFFRTFSRPNHNGVDLNYDGGGDTDFGSPIVATHSGRVARINPDSDGRGGRIVVIESLDGSFETKYMHLSSIVVQENQEISEGETIGLMGGSGFGKENSYLAHLHYEIHRNGAAVNPWENGNLVDPQLWQSQRPLTEEQYFNSVGFLDALYSLIEQPLRSRTIELGEVTVIASKRSKVKPIDTKPSPITPVKPLPIDPELVAPTPKPPKPPKPPKRKTNPDFY